ncbi:cytochrome ubiquinol oxidase subunit I [Desulfovibrio mangrovi]|uniref:cytochrome ubiquinol oxidase subunit I n=1 Tax=Desulfovibrio mangrovi TaxID=2976983 RepID=UPI002245072D|nr:cytochrome ubiquinol oxidase subunit I [Desulfovibrio mangrovi]UZP66871.1 cytochrome ubiquinol oxidase subunit I [Desulfovibrio mangrovi]
MEYPVWWIPELSGGFIIACMAVFHVFIAHFAVGGGLFLVLTERKAVRENDNRILEYVQAHTKFFLLLTMVAGGMTGVGIWFTIGLLSPAATSTLVHSYGFGWAIEWVAFLCEIVALLLYHYRFKQMSRRDHMVLGWFYFFFAYMSLFVINGIITSMLTPGDWLQTQRFWDGFFNPTFWPSLALRTSICFMAAGLFALVTAIRIKEEGTRERMVRYAVRWVGIPFLLMLPAGLWYLFSLPEPQFSMVLQKSAQTPQLVRVFYPLTVAIILGGLAVAHIRTTACRAALVGVLVLAGVGHMGTFEWIREAGRRPYLIHGHTWSNSVKVSETATIRQEGALQHAKWVKLREVTPQNLLAAGEELYRLQCLACHSIGGPMLSAETRTAALTRTGLEAQLSGQGRLRNFMPPFLGTEGERLALAAYIADVIQKREPDAAPVSPQALATIIPAFNRHEAEYVLVAWATMGMTTISDNNDRFTMQPPGVTVRAQLLRRDDTPELLTEGVSLSYRMEKGFETPSKHVTFWDHAASLFGIDLPENAGIGPDGLAGAPMEGQFAPDEDHRAFVVHGLAAMPYNNDGSVNPYPLLTVEARDESGELLAETQVAVPVSTEWGCRNCHDGGWRVADRTGMSDETAGNILAAHDKINKTDLVERAAKGNPVLCQSCHGSAKLGTEGQEGLIGFSAAVHGWHANYLGEKDDRSCKSCHPAARASFTQGLRGVHASKGLTCMNCHGTLEDHALGLLKKEKELGKRGVDKLMTYLSPRVAESYEDVQARSPWVSEPDCTVCHDFFSTPPADASAAHKWTSGDPAELYSERQDDMGAIMCQACHGSTHALYPAENAYGLLRNNIIPMQYQQLAGPLGRGNNCICHTRELTVYESAHHPIIPK